MPFEIRLIVDPKKKREVSTEIPTHFLVLSPTPEVEYAYPKTIWEKVPAVSKEDVTGQVTFKDGTFLYKGQAITERHWKDGSFEMTNDGSAAKILRRV